MDSPARRDEALLVGLGNVITPPILDNGPLSDTQATLNSISHPNGDLSKFGISNFQNVAAANNFGPCQKAFSNNWNIAHNLTRDSYDMAKAAAADAKVPLPEVLDVWYQEGSLMTSGSIEGHDLWTPRKPAGDIGPMQVTNSATNQLENMGELPDNYNTDAAANMIAGARYFSWILGAKTGGRPFAAYHVGPKGARLGRGRSYESAFRKILPMLTDFVKCMGD